MTRMVGGDDDGMCARHVCALNAKKDGNLSLSFVRALSTTACVHLIHSVSQPPPSPYSWVRKKALWQAIRKYVLSWLSLRRGLMLLSFS